MATYAHDVVTTRIHRWLIPFGRNGVPDADVATAWTAATRAFREARGLPEEAELPDDALYFSADDDHLIIFFTLTE